MRTLRIILLSTILTGGLIFSSCSKDKDKTDPEIKVESITLNKSTLTLTVGNDETLEATIEPEEAENVKITWESSNEDVATVKNGKVTAVSAGKAVITASAGGEEASCVVTVNPINELVGTTWDWTLNVEGVIGSFFIFNSETEVSRDQFLGGITGLRTGTYTYEKPNIIITLNDDTYTEEIFVGTVNGNEMTLQLSGGSITTYIKRE